MNKRFLQAFFSLLFLVTQAFSQVPNGGFEQWTNGEPDGWYTNNFPDINFVTVTQTNDSHSGTSALRGEAITTNTGIYYSIITSGKQGEKGITCF